MIFENHPISLQDLPTIETVNYQRLDPAHLRVKFIGNTIFFIIMLAVILNLWRIPVIGDDSMLSNGLLILWSVWTVLSFFFTWKGFQIEGYAVRQKDILHIQGVLTRRQVAIPFNRVQHCEIKEGPIQRYFKLKTLEVYTAGGHSSDLSIDGLRGETAQRVKEFIVKTTAEEGIDEEE